MERLEVFAPVAEKMERTYHRSESLEFKFRKTSAVFLHTELTNHDWTENYLLLVSIPAPILMTNPIISL